MDLSNKKIIKTIVMAFIIIGSILTFGIKFYMDNAALSVDRPTFIKVSPNQLAALLIGNKIYLFDKQQETNSIINFDHLGLNLIGDFDFFSNGDLLVYSNKEEQSLLQNLKQYARLQETRKDFPSHDNGFYRCQVEVQICQKFNNNLPAFHSSFRIVIDHQSDTIYIADTPKFALYKIDNSGMLLAQNTDNLHFPNQLTLHNNELYIANTNKHSVKIVHTDTPQFGHEINSHQTVIDAENRWPSEVIKTPQGWWVSIAGSNMSHARIQIYDDNWKSINLVTPLNNQADTWSMALFDNSVLVTDWTNIALYHFNLSGAPLPDINNIDINLAFKKSKQLENQYSNSASNAFIAFCIVFILGVIAAFVLEKKESLAAFNLPIKNSQETNESNEILMPPGKETYWIEAKWAKYKKLLSGALLLSIPFYILPFIELDLNKTDINWTFIVLGIAFSSLMILASWSLYRALSVKIGITGHLLIIDEGNGTVGIGKENAIQYTKNTIIIDKAVATLGPPNSPVFPKDELNKWVNPRIQKGKPMNQWELYKALWALKHPSIMMAIMVLSYMVIILLFDYL